MKILFVLENYFPNVGGVETLFKTLVEALDQQNLDIIVVTTRLSTNDPIKEKQGNITIVRLPFPNRYFFTLFAFFPILWYSRGCQMIHTTSYNAGFPAFFAAKLARKKIIITFHEAWGKLWFDLPFMGNLAKKGHYAFEQMLLKMPFDKFIAVSKSTAKRLEEEGVEAKRITTIYNGINYKEFDINLPAKQKDAPFVYTYFGRLGISKGIDILLDAAELFHQSNPNSQLQLIVPTTPDSFLKIIFDLIEGKGLNGYVKVLHELPFDKLKATLKASDCVVVPSYSEGFCFAAVETIALGVPLISSDKAALKEVVGGQYIKLKELTGEELHDALEQAYVGNWQKSSVIKFELEHTVQAYLDLYQKELGVLEKA